MKSIAVSAIKEVISVAEAKTHLRVSTSSDDTYIGNLITTARLWTEKYLNTSIVANTFDVAMDRFPRVFDIKNFPLVKIERLSYFTGSVLTDVSKSNYDIDRFGVVCRVDPSNGFTWPTPDVRTNAVRLRYTAGYLLPILAANINNTTNIFTVVNHDFIENDTITFHLTGGSGVIPTGLTAGVTYYIISVVGDTFQVSATEGGSAVSISDSGTDDIYISTVGGLPETIRQAMLLLIGDMYLNRCIAPRKVMNNTLYELLDPFRVVLLA